MPSPKNTRAPGSFFSPGSRFSSGSPGLSPDLPELSLPSSEKAAALLSPPQGKPKVWDRLGQFHLPGLPKTELTKICRAECRLPFIATRLGQLPRTSDHSEAAAPFEDCYSLWFPNKVSGAITAQNEKF